MKRETIKTMIPLLIDNSINGLEQESNKIDFKSEWYNLKTKKGISEFVKDFTAIANTVGLDGLIIIGYDEKKRKIIGSTFIESGLKDTNELHGILQKKTGQIVDYNLIELEYDQKPISVIHIPPTFEKPVVIKNHQTFFEAGNIKKEEKQRIFVRKGTSTFEASKYDLEMMFYDRKNIIPEYKVISNLTEVEPIFEGFNKISENFKLKFSLENLGLRPIAIKDITILVENSAEISKEDGSLFGSLEVNLTHVLDPIIILGKGEILFFADLVFHMKYDKKSTSQTDILNIGALFATGHANLLLKLTSNKIIQVNLVNLDE